MNNEAFLKIQVLLDNSGINYQVYNHPECRTSEESARVRREVGMPEAIGAKALVCKVDFRGGENEFVVFVLPGTHAIEKAKLKIELPEIKQFRFASSDELMDLAGVVPGCMPPFGKQIFPKITRAYISPALQDFERLAFNAAKLDTSITLFSKDYLAIVQADKVFNFSTPKI